MALTAKQKKINRIKKKLERERFLRDHIIAHRVGPKGQWNNFQVAIRYDDGRIFGIEGAFPGYEARYTKDLYRAEHAQNVRDLMAELRELKASKE